jgi:poly-gamma-glutamate capsule biosynthesis protein CapA/YwtB (metallophosphatase superfamily)
VVHEPDKRRIVALTLREPTLFTIASMVALAGCAPRPRAARIASPAVREASLELPATPPPDIDLLAVTAYSASRDDISTAELTRGVCDGTIPVVAEARAKAEARFGCKTLRETTLDDTLGAKLDIAVTDLDHLTSQLKALRVDGVSLFAAPDRYPLAAGSIRTTHFTDFVMTGVTAIARATGVACEKHGIAWLTANLRAQLAGADYVHISNEVSIVPDCKYVSGTLQFCSKEHEFQALLDVHANVVELTGNHNRDYGDAAARATLAWYERHGIKTFGGGSDPVSASHALVLALDGGKKLGIIGFNELCDQHECSTRPGEVGANPYDDAKAFAAIAHLRDVEHVDQVFVTVQFREWDSPHPTPMQTRISHALIDHGADLVLGSQAHQLQWIEFYKGKPIYNGLGNFLFDQIKRPAVRQAFFLHHYFFQGKLVQSVPVFTYMADDRQPTLATPEQVSAMRAIVFERATGH